MHQDSGIGVRPQIGRDWRERRAVAPVNLLNVHSPRHNRLEIYSASFGAKQPHILILSMPDSWTISADPSTEYMLNGSS